MRCALLDCSLLLVLLASPAIAAPDCEDDYSECKDDCMIAYGGSVKLDMKRSFEKCLKKCTRAANLCTEHQTETSANHLDEGALEHSPGSDEVDSNNMPNRTTGGTGKKPKKAAPADPLRDPEDDAPAKPKEALGEGEVPRSSRTQLKSEDDKPRKAGKAKDTREPKEASPAPRNEAKPSRADEDLRDDGLRAETPPPKPKSEPKAEPKPKEPPKHKEEDDDLKNF